ncbi:MAG: hypothetical protein AAFW70_03730 [Cyanobacteria bacterium J06635_10]
MSKSLILNGWLIPEIAGDVAVLRLYSPSEFMKLILDSVGLTRNNAEA